MPEESNNLNLLRTIAVLSVFVAHILPPSTTALNLGHAGVLLFFVHTSNVLMRSLRRRGDSWAQFMIRRCFRIYPLAIVAVLLYELLAIGNVGPQGPASATTLLADATLTQNLFHAISIPAVLWSLPYEIQMYLLLPAIFYFVSRRRYSGVDIIATWTSIFFVFTVGVLLLPISVVNLIRFVPCFLAGVMAFALPDRRYLPPVFLPALLLLGLVAYAFVSDFLFSAWLLCCLTGLGLPLVREFSARPVASSCAFIAKYSYGIYLFHSIFMALLLHRLGTPVGAVSAFALTVLGSYLAFHLLERRLTVLGGRISDAYFGSKFSPIETVPFLARRD